MVACAASGILLTALWKAYERQHWLSLVPARFGVGTIVYAKDRSWGFGPGGNETGVVLFELPQATADAIGRSGGAYLASLQDGLHWEPTPLRDRRDWLNCEGSSQWSCPSESPHLANYLDQYGFSIPVSPSVTAEIDRALSSTGSFYAYTRTGVLLVIPRTRRVAFVYAG